MRKRHYYTLQEGIAAVENIKGLHGHVNYNAIPGVIYTYPEVRSTYIAGARSCFSCSRCGVSLLAGCDGRPDRGATQGEGHCVLQGRLPLCSKLPREGHAGMFDTEPLHWVLSGQTSYALIGHAIAG